MTDVQSRKHPPYIHAPSLGPPYRTEFSWTGNSALLKTLSYTRVDAPSPKMSIVRSIDIYKIHCVDGRDFISKQAPMEDTESGYREGRIAFLTLSYSKEWREEQRRRTLSESNTRTNRWL